MPPNTNPNRQYYAAEHIQFNVLPISDGKQFHLIAWSTSNGQILSRYTTKSLEEAEDNIDQVYNRAITRTTRPDSVKVIIFESECNRFVTQHHHVEQSGDSYAD